MPDRSRNLTRVDAANRAATVTVDHYQIDLDLTDGNGQPGVGTFRSKTTVTCTAEPGAETFIDISPGTDKGGNIFSATLNGVKIPVSDYDEKQGITLSGLAEANTVVVEADCAYSNDGQGLVRSVDKSDNNEVYLYTQFETADAKRMFTCFDQPDLKATFGLTVTAPAQWQVISNATASIDATGDTKVHTFASTPRLSTYLVALIAGPYARRDDTYTDEHGAIPLGIYCRKSLEQFLDADVLFDLTKRSFHFFHQNFGITYPFGKYDQVFCPDYNAGAMENVAAVTFKDDYVFRGKATRTLRARRAETLFHEMAHMWFGNLVTMKWWDDLWLNESFATWAANLGIAEATEFAEAWTTFANVEKPKAYRQDQLPSTHPVAGEVPDLDSVHANFDAITYIKGAGLLKQLVALMGRDHFLNGLRDYFNDHRFSNADLRDLLAALQRHAGGRDLVGWAKQWLETTGLNTLQADFDVNGDALTRFAVTQTGAKPGNNQTRVHRVRVGVYNDGQNRKLVRTHQTEPLEIAGGETDVPALQGIARGELILVNDDDLTYCSLCLDPRSLETARTRIGDIYDPLPRAQAWSTLWEMTRDAEFRARDFVALVTSNLKAETSIAVAQNLLLQAQTALTYYAQPDWARSDQGWPAFADQVLDLARTALPGSDYQLAYIQALCADREKERQRSSVLSARHTDLLAALLHTTNPAELGLEGLEVDTVLRWRIVIALATAGAIDSNVIDAEARRDPNGLLNAVQATAARPERAAKETAWNRLINEEGISNSEARATAAGFAAPGQAQLLQPYSARYFDKIPDVWAHRSESVATTLAVGLYPLWEVSTDAIGAAGALLDRIADRDDLTGLRRRVREGQAEVKRALDARHVDASECPPG